MSARVRCLSKPTLSYRRSKPYLSPTTTFHFTHPSVEDGSSNILRMIFMCYAGCLGVSFAPGGFIYLFGLWIIWLRTASGTHLGFLILLYFPTFWRHFLPPITGRRERQHIQGIGEPVHIPHCRTSGGSKEKLGVGLWMDGWGRRGRAVGLEKQNERTVLSVLLSMCTYCGS